MVSATKLEGEYSFHGKNSPLDQSEGVKLHLYRLGTEKHGNDALKFSTCPYQGSPTLLDTIIISQWEDFTQMGQLEYDVTACKLKVTEGEMNFVIQMNDKLNSFMFKGYDKFRHSFGCLKPNCTKSYEGLLLCIAQGEKDIPEIILSTPPSKDGVMLVANAYPIEYGHIFFVPSSTNQLSDKMMFGLVTEVVSEVKNAAFRVFIDDGTSAIPDHRFFQACYFANPLPVESASTVVVYDGKARSGISVSEIVDYPLKALVFTSSNVNALIDLVDEVSLTLHGSNTEHSLLISNHGENVFLFPQVKNLADGCYLSAWECCGYFVCHTKFDFDRASETVISDRMASYSLQNGAFQDLKNLCCAIANNLAM